MVQEDSQAYDSGPIGQETDPIQEPILDEKQISSAKDPIVETFPTEENPYTPPVMQEERESSTRKTGTLLQKIGLNLLMVGVLILLGYLAWQRFAPKGESQALANAQESSAESSSHQLDSPPQEIHDTVALESFSLPASYAPQGILRETELKTIIPNRPRDDVITYTVQTGDTLFSIAYKYNLKPATLLWGNFDVLQDNPHFLTPKQVLNILPVNGTYYQWKEGDTLDGVASFFKVDPEAILSYPGNKVDLTRVKEANSGIEPETWIIIPGGKRAIKDWGPPAISRQNPAAARYYGEGSCGSVYEGAIGTGTFIWPTTERFVSGYDYDSGVHPGIDIGGSVGNAVYATDSGVVVYAGWSNYGYGYLIVIDHGTGWQSAYGHLSAVAVTCGQSVYQGGYIGALGSTGNSSGPHLHFELLINGAKVNPQDYLH